MELGERVTYFFRLSGDTYGSPRITLDLWAQGWKVSVNMVAEIMAGLGLRGPQAPAPDEVTAPAGQAEGIS
ncbi:transposase [Streptomyces sp. NBC_01515]|uniref:IS3 family transposase n=1 Tax=Streptomyces sp. NBC_01515 TaxID=2903890 RepID=UPI00386BA4A1